VKQLIRVVEPKSSKNVLLFNSEHTAIKC